MNGRSHEYSKHEEFFSFVVVSFQIYKVKNDKNKSKRKKYE